MRPSPQPGPALASHSRQPAPAGAAPGRCRRAAARPHRCGRAGRQAAVARQGAGDGRRHARLPGHRALARTRRASRSTPPRPTSAPRRSPRATSRRSTTSRPGCRRATRGGSDAPLAQRAALRPRDPLRRAQPAAAAALSAGVERPRPARHPERHGHRRSCSTSTAHASWRSASAFRSRADGWRSPATRPPRLLAEFGAPVGGQAAPLLHARRPRHARPGPCAQRARRMLDRVLAESEPETLLLESYFEGQRARPVDPGP